jgi:hydroxyacylglutathione hydrolase
VRISHVFETHIHNDDVTGGFALAKATGAAYHVNADDPVGLARVPVRDGDTIAEGDTHAGAGAGHPRAHLHPPRLRAGGT